MAFSIVNIVVSARESVEYVCHNACLFLVPSVLLQCIVHVVGFAMYYVLGSHCMYVLGFCCM